MDGGAANALVLVVVTLPFWCIIRHTITIDRERW